MGISGRRRLAAILGTAGLAAVLAVGGCGAGGQGNSASDGAPAGPAADKQAGAGTGPAADPGQPGSAPPVAQRAIIYTGSITVRVDDVDRAASRATAIVTTAGGFVGGDKRSSDASSSRASLELRVPADRFQRVVDELAGLGRPEQRDLNSQDVTEETIDLDARITTQRARVDSGRRLLAQAKTLNDLVMLESELAKREADLASLEAKKRRLADLTALSTITAELLGPDAQPAETDTGFLAGLRGGWTALLGSLQILLTVLGALLPFAVVLGLPVAGVIWLWRRAKRRRPSRAPARMPAGPVPAGMPAGPVPAGPVPAGMPAGAVPAARGPMSGPGGGMPGPAGSGPTPGPAGPGPALPGPVGPDSAPRSAPAGGSEDGGPS